MYATGPGFDYEAYMRNLDRQLSAGGGVDPAGPPTEPNLDDYSGNDPNVGNPNPVSAPPSQAQKTAKEVYGIGSSGPMAEQANRNVDQYAAGRDNQFAKTGQYEPQQFGSIENTFLAENPLKPKDAVETFLKDNYVPGVTKVDRGPSKHVSPQQQLEKNRAYDAKVQEDRNAREAERNQLAQRGDANRARSREKDADMWAQFRSMGSLQGAAPNAQFSGGPMGPSAQNVGGAILLGPGFGASPYGRYGPRVNLDPYAEDKLRLRQQQEERLREQGANKTEADAARNETSKESIRQRREAAAMVNDRFNTVNGQRVKKTFDERTKTFETLLADYDRRSRAFLAAKAAGEDPLIARDSEADVADPKNPGKYVKGAPYPGSFRAIQRRLFALGQDIAQEDPEGVKYPIPPETLEKWKAIRADLEATPDDPRLGGLNQ